MAKAEVTQTFTAEDQVTDWISSTHDNPDDTLDVSFQVDSDWVGLVWLQKSYDRGATAHNVDYMTYDIEFAISDNREEVWYRLKCVYYEKGQATGGIYK